MSEQKFSHDNGRLAKDMLGFTVTDITDNPDLVVQKLDELFGNLKAFVTAVTGDDETALESARGQMHDLQTTLAAHGLETNDNMADLPDKIHAAYHEDQAQRQQEIAAGLEKLAQEIRLAADVLAQQIQAQAEKYAEPAPESEIMPGPSLDSE